MASLTVPTLAEAAFARAVAERMSGARVPLADGADPGGRFASLVQAAAAPVARAQREAERHIALFQAGEEPEIHQTMVALEKANIVLRLAVSLRDKGVEAFERCLQLGQG